MKIVVQRQGGFAGISRRGEVDGGALSPEQREALDALLNGPQKPPDPGADRFSYKIEVHDEAGTRSITVPETAMPAHLKAIVGP